jgi:hypothetical protein
LRLGHDKRIKKKFTPKREREGGSNGRWENRAIFTLFSTILTALAPLKAAEWSCIRARKVLPAVMKQKKIILSYRDTKLIAGYGLHNFHLEQVLMI